MSEGSIGFRGFSGLFGTRAREAAAPRIAIFLLFNTRKTTLGFADDLLYASTKQSAQSAESG